ncbi:hypothetical protein SVI_0974 [Shewanella violacea DSS12]|uniref:Uncharacterized protein n=1 Tax=Shewanella violacea (strain JCM 10179 / CIP 106290 / LMG 19151 / DSS12) TaxID=637905 RepID=D4ZGZ6_SHEVD|nr:hypothetical protein SVI_0974 [Shewanella violacea DSS12]
MISAFIKPKALNKQSLRQRKESSIALLNKDLIKHKIFNHE